jgi:GTP-binding protein
MATLVALRLCNGHTVGVSFVDKVPVTIHAGDGGDGAVSFRHEKFIDHGGPDGGDGGDGGSIVFVASRNQDTLANFRFQKELHAENGTAGTKRRRHGKNGADLRVMVPIGTSVADEDGQILVDLEEDDQEAIIAKGGKGGFGNAHFISSTRQTPKIAEKGEAGELLTVQLELKMIADVGLVGLPNAGKSTLLSVVSNARPEIANYPFTTLTPNLGVVDIDKEHTLLFADIPGLIEGAAEGKGLGDEFLRHVERTAVLVHLIDAYQEAIAEAYQTIQDELSAYKVNLSKKPQIVALTKIEGLDAEIVAEQLGKLKAVVPKNTPILAISAKSNEGMADFLRQIRSMVDTERAHKKALEEESPEESVPVFRMSSDDEQWHVVREKKYFVVNGQKIERFAGRTDFSNEAGVERLVDIMKKMGIMHELVRQGVKTGDRIVIGNAGEIIY